MLPGASGMLVGARFQVTAVAASLLAVGVVGYIAVTLPSRDSVGTSRIVTEKPQAQRAQAPERSPGAAPHPTRGALMPRAVANPNTATLLVRSDPSGAQILVMGVPRGTTPLMLRGRPGERIRLLLRKQDLTWRGTVVLDDRNQTLDAALTDSSAMSAAGTPTPWGTTEFEMALRAGIDLYNQGWYGPAAGRLKQAIILNPQSAETYLWLARALVRVHRYGEALYAIQAIMSIEKSGPVVEEAEELRRTIP